MATVNVKYTCGCGYSTKKVEEAINHSDKEKHSMCITGVVEKKVE